MDNATSGSVELPCFFCLRDTGRNFCSSGCKSDGCGINEPHYNHEFSLRNLYRFFNSLRSDEEDKVLNELKMRTCEHCSRLVKEFNDLYNLLEETKLRLNWCIRKLETVMSKAENESEKKEDKKVAEMLRTDAMKRMKAIIPLPQIVLNKVKGIMRRQLSSVSPEDSNDNEGKSAKLLKEEVEVRLDTEIIDDEKLLSPDGCHGATVLDGSITESIFPKESQRKESKEKSICRGNTFKTHRSSTKPNPNKIKRSPGYLSNFTPLLGLFPSSNKKVRCKLCKKTFDRSKAFAHWRAFHRNSPKSNNLVSSECTYCPLVSKNKESMIQHHVRLHPEHYFQAEMEKAASSTLTLTLEQFQSILVDALFPEFSTETKEYTSCSVCKLKYDGKTKSTNRVQMRRHLIYRHKTELDKRLKLILEDELLKKSVSSQQKDETDDDRLSKCPHCPFKYTGKGRGMSYSMTRHQVIFHPEQYFPEEREKVPGLTLKQFQRIMRDLLIPDFILKSDADGFLSCSLCPVKYRDGKGVFALIRRHLIFRHRTELKEKLKAILGDPKLEEVLKSLDPEKEIADVTSPSECPYCPCVAVSYETMITHLVSFHPEHFLLAEEMPENWRDDPEPIRKILTDIVLPKFVLTFGMDTSCSFCEVKCSTGDHLGNNIVMAKKHVLFMHKDELKEEVRIVLDELKEKVEESPKSPKKKTKCNYCPFECTRTSSLINHLIRYHPEHFLVDEKVAPPEVELETRKMLTEVVFPKFILNTGIATTCSSCGLNFGESDRSWNNYNLVLAKRHVMFAHKNQVKEELRAIMHGLKIISEGHIERGNGQIRISRQPISSESVINARKTYAEETEKVVQDYMSKFIPLPSSSNELNEPIVICKLCMNTVKRCHAFEHVHFHCGKGPQESV